MLKIGLTGIIGSGKSLVASIFRHWDIPVFSSDKAAKILMETNPVLKKKILEYLGRSAYTETGNVNTSYISQCIFSDVTVREKLQSIVHSYVIKESNSWFSRQCAVYVLKESALLFETGQEQDLDYIVTVDAPECLCVQRLILARKMSEPKIRGIIAVQKQKNNYSDCDFILKNDEQTPLLPQILHLHQRLAGKSL